MDKLNLPEYRIEVRENDPEKRIWDPVRRKFILNTPEEWVRQNFLRYLHYSKGYPFNWMEVEKGLKVHKLFRRCDILAHKKDGSPLLIVECKAPNVSIDQNVFDQIARYNIGLQVPYLIVTNGLSHYCCYIDISQKQRHFLRDIPEWKALQE